MEKQRWEESEKKKVRRKKMQMCEEVEKARHTVFFLCFVAPEGWKVGSRKRRVRSHLKKNCIPLTTTKTTTTTTTITTHTTTAAITTTLHYNYNYHYQPALHYNALHYTYYITLRYTAPQRACIGARFCFLEEAVFCCYLWSTASYANYRKWSFEPLSQTTLPSQTCIYTALPMKERM